MLSAKGEKDNGCIINTCFQVASNPLRLAISVQAGNFTREIIENTGVFNVSVLTEDTPFDLIKRFGMATGRETDKFAGFDAVKRSGNGILHLTQHVNAVFSCKVLSKTDLGSHTMFIGEVTAAEKISSVPSCTYAHYHKAIKPKR